MDESVSEKGAKYDSPKRPSSDNSEEAPPSKKVRLGFSAKDFRKSLKNNQKTQILHGFLQQISDDEDIILSYLENGGSALEILHTMEGDYGVSPLLAFDVVNRILLQIGANLPQFQAGAYDACRLLLNSYLPQINKMLGLSSSMKERVITIKLLTTIVTFSAVLAKDILLNVNFNPTNIELLTKVSEGRNEARQAFVHFITAFLVDGHFAALSVLLEKRGFMTSIISGLQFDDANVVVLVLTAMKAHVLENVAVSKTAKMRIFNTQIVKFIVNLYNWKGPGALHQKTKTPVDELDKSKVNEAVHGFLLVLCTSHKFGVIFKDPMYGLNQKQNMLMYTVLQSLERPWEHSYASELVIEIAKACPDLVKFLWNSLKGFVEPRWSEKWLKSVDFAARILDGFQPEDFDLTDKPLTTQQFTQVIIGLTSPAPFINKLIPENHIFDKPATKFSVMKLFLKILTKLANFLKIWAASLNETSIKVHVLKHFPSAELILKNWEENDENYLDVAFDLLSLYKLISPTKVDDLGVDMNDFFVKSDQIDKKAQIKAADFFLNLEPLAFKVQTKLFRTLLDFSLECYYNSKDEKVFSVLNKLLNNSGMFDAFQHESNFWINAILNLKSYDSSISEFLCDLLQKCEENAASYSKKLNDLDAGFSALIVALNDLDFSKNIKTYLNFVLLGIFHTQPNLNAFVQVLNTNVNEKLLNYFKSWGSGQVAVLCKAKGVLTDQFHHFSTMFLNQHFEDFHFNLYSDCTLNVLQMVVFYLSNLINIGLENNHKTNCSKLVKYLLDGKYFSEDRYIGAVLENPTLLEHFSVFTSDDFTLKIVLDVLRNIDRNNEHLVAFRHKVVSQLVKLFKNPDKHSKVQISLEVLEIVALDYEQCANLLTKFVSSEKNSSFYLVACHCLNRMTELGKSYAFEPINLDVMKALTRIFVSLVKNQPNINIFSSSLHSYLKIFPHFLQVIHCDLFESLASMSEFNKDNLSFCEFLLERDSKCTDSFLKNLNEICSKRSFILFLLDAAVQKLQTDEKSLKAVFTNIESHINKALQKPHKAGQHFQNRYRSLGVLIEKFMNCEHYGDQVEKFETTELFHVYLLKIIYGKVPVKNEKVLSNMIMTFVHLMSSLLKQKSPQNLTEIAEIMLEFLVSLPKDNVLLSSNETFKNFCKLCLKHGIGGDFVLLKVLKELVERCVLEDDAKLVLEMMLSHSQFLDVILGDAKKDGIFQLWHVLCTKWPQFMERNHVPVLLSAYSGTKADAVILNIIKMYESKSSQTKFFDFKPFLWGKAAAAHYSVRSETKVLWRQPKTSDVLSNLNEPTVQKTVTNPNHSDSYDLDFFLPLFSHLLAPENPVPTYFFTRYGALALTVCGFRGKTAQIMASCNVLQRFHFHLESNPRGKDVNLWLRFVEALCKGVAQLENFRTNSFVSLFWGQMALVLTQPSHVMYVPMTLYLSAKESPNFGSIPELYTFLHSPHVNSKHYKHFILKVLHDGLNTKQDFKCFMKSMAFKLVSELMSSVVCDSETKLLILDVLQKCCEIDLGAKLLCLSSLLTQIFSLVLCNMDEEVLCKLLKILLTVVERDADRHRNFIVYLNLLVLVDNWSQLEAGNSLRDYYRILAVIVGRFPDFFTDENAEQVLARSGDRFCQYLVRFGCGFVRENDCQCLQLVFYNKLNVT